MTRDWVGFYQTFYIDQSGYGIVVDKPTASQLDAFEKTAGFKLPKSYREFMLVFGPGEFSASLRIAGPGYSKLVNPSFDLDTCNQSYRLTPDDIAAFPANEHEQLNRLYFFGVIDASEWLAWDTGDVRSLTETEYAIYRVSLRKTVFLAGSFSDMIDVVCGQLFAPNLEWDESELGPHRTFSPATYDPDAS